MKYKSLFLSDIHLGTAVCQADKLLEFLKTLETEDGYKTERLFLVGDIIDFEAMSKGYKGWSKSHTTVVQKFLRMSRKGVKIYYVLGNHDILLRYVNGWNFGDIEIIERFEEDTPTGKTLILHGHQYDGFVKSIPLLYWIGDNAYMFMLFVNKWYNRLRKLFGYKYWSLSHYLKTKVKSVLSFMNKFNTMIVEDCKKEDIKNVIYGHTHLPGINKLEDIYVINTGCSTELTTCVIEKESGVYTLIDYVTGEEIAKNIDSN